MLSGHRGSVAKQFSSHPKLSRPAVATAAAPFCPRLVIRAHKDALVALRTFWQALLHNNVKFTALASALNEIERTVLKVTV